jgi:CheY-like chemotaxis protein
MSAEGSPVVLAVEDEPLNRRLLHAILTPSGYQVVDAPSLTAARAWLQGNRPDLILLDLRLPDGDGLDLARELKADPALRSIPVVVATASAMPPVHAQAMAAGVDGFLAKPIAAGRLRSEIAAHIQKARSRAVS